MGVLIELASDPAMPVDQAVTLLMSLPAKPPPVDRWNWARAARNPNIGPGGCYRSGAADQLRGRQQTTTPAEPAEPSPPGSESLLKLDHSRRR